jgi:Flp pilus assembly protein TadD
MEKVIYHNAIDVLSLVTLTNHALNRHREEQLADLSGAEALAVARWHLMAGRLEQTERAFQRAISSKGKQAQLEALRGYSLYLKRHGRFEEAISHWIKWNKLDPKDPTPCIEVAKIYEWRIKDLGHARTWAQTALCCLEAWPKDWRYETIQEEIKHRLDRLDRKIIKIENH